jgi:hypothetical protein
LNNCELIYNQICLYRFGSRFCMGAKVMVIKISSGKISSKTRNLK